jgi:hypothetical protein
MLVEKFTGVWVVSFSCTKLCQVWGVTIILAKYPNPSGVQSAIGTLKNFTHMGIEEKLFFFFFNGIPGFHLLKIISFSRTWKDSKFKILMKQNH